MFIPIPLEEHLPGLDIVLENPTGCHPALAIDVPIGQIQEPLVVYVGECGFAVVDDVELMHVEGHRVFGSWDYDLLTIILIDYRAIAIFLLEV